MVGQLGFAEGWISAKVGRNASLERLSVEVKWDRFEKLLAKLKPQGAGRPPFEPLLMLKGLLLQQCYALSDADLEEAINDRVSFRKFLGLSLEAPSPDHTTLCRFRGRLAEAGLSKTLFAEFERQLDQRGLILKRGTMIDASLVETPFRPGSSGGDRAAVDADARLTVRKGKAGAHYGYKLHAGVDQESRLIRRVDLTPANINDTVPADRLVCGDERAIYADKGYAKRDRRRWLASLGIKPRIMHKSWGGGPPLTHWQRLHNTLISPIRAQVEGVFATLKRWMGMPPGPVQRPRQKPKPPVPRRPRLQHEQVAQAHLITAPPTAQQPKSALAATDPKPSPARLHIPDPKTSITQRSPEGEGLKTMSPLFRIWYKTAP